MAKVEEPRAVPGGPDTRQAATAERMRLAQEQSRRMGPLVTLVVVGVLVAAHAFGWQLTKIDFPGLIRDSPKMGRIVAQLIAPDVVVYDKTARAETIVPVFGTDVPNPDATPVSVTQAAQPQVVITGTEATAFEGVGPISVTLTINPGEVTAEQPVTVTGHFALPAIYKGAKDGELRWARAGGFPKTVAKFQTDANGDFTTSFLAPDSSQVQEENNLAAAITWGVGNLKLSPTLIDTSGPEWTGVIPKIAETIFQALMGTTFAVIISLPLSFFAARNIMGQSLVGRMMYYFARTLLNLLRSIEVLIMATIFVAAVGIGPFAGVLALVVHSVASLGKLYSEAIESIDPGPIEAITATGAGRLQTIVFAIIPQFIPQFISFTLYRWDVNVRMSTIIGFVGGGGIGFILTQYINLLDWAKAGTAIWTIAIVVIVIDLVSARIRQAVI